MQEWLEENRDNIDIRDRQLILQQVINTLATIHTIGNEEFLSLWGSFLGMCACVCESMQVCVIVVCVCACVC